LERDGLPFLGLPLFDHREDFKRKLQAGAHVVDHNYIDK
jgi:hypothetical protein